MITPRELKELYEKGQNISTILRGEAQVPYNTEKMIELSYDLQTGSYIAAMDDPAYSSHKAAYTAQIAATIQSLCAPSSILEAGVGEATTLPGVLRSLDDPSLACYGFDLSWSRVAYAAAWLKSQNRSHVTLCTGSLLNIPFANNSIDLVYTSHSIEPNRGFEGSIIRELVRVTRKYLLLLEPAYELASEEARRRMDQYGYCRGLRKQAEALGCEVIAHGLFPFQANPLNPTAMTVIRKETGQPPPARLLACPRFKTPLEEIGGMLFSPEALVLYPVVMGIPCLRIENGIVASRFPELAATAAKQGR